MSTYFIGDPFYTKASSTGDPKPHATGHPSTTAEHTCRNADESLPERLVLSTLLPDHSTLGESRLDFETETTSKPIGQAAALGTIIALLIAALFWIFNVSSTANEAQRLSNANTERIEGKADKQDIQRIYDKLDEINKYLRDRK